MVDISVGCIVTKRWSVVCKGRGRIELGAVYKDLNTCRSFLSLDLSIIMQKQAWDHRSRARGVTAAHRKLLDCSSTLFNSLQRFLRA